MFRKKKEEKQAEENYGQKYLEDTIRGSVVRIDESEELMFADLAKVIGFKDYLVKTMALDIRRHFDTSDEGRDLARGAYLRTQYLYKKLLEYSEVDKK